MSNSTDNFERIAQEAVIALTSVVLTLRVTGGPDYQQLADVIAERTEQLIDRAIAL